MPVLHAAAMRVKEKIQNDLSGSYNIICEGDSATRTHHANASLHQLTGYINVAHLPHGVYARYVGGDIVLNSTVVNASARYFNGQ